MAEKRMFSKEIIDSDAFLTMPVSSQNLYFHLGMRADDDGFVNKVQSIMAMCKASADDLRVLVSKKYIIPFESGIIVIKHWRINNYIQKDRYKSTNYIDLLKLLEINENKSYSLKSAENSECIQNVYNMDTQIRLDKIRLDKIREESAPAREEAAAFVGQSPTPLIHDIVCYLNSRTGKSFKASTDSTKKHINARLREGYTVDDFKAVIDFKVSEWQGSEMQQFLRPDTLFGTKFESYLQAAKIWQKEQAIKEEKAAKQAEAERKVAEEHREAERMQRFLQDDTYRKLEARRKQLVLALSKGECAQSEYDTAVEAVERRKGELC